MPPVRPDHGGQALVHPVRLVRRDLELGDAGQVAGRVVPGRHGVGAQFLQLSAAVGGPHALGVPRRALPARVVRRVEHRQLDRGHLVQAFLRRRPRPGDERVAGGRLLRGGAQPGDQAGGHRGQVQPAPDLRLAGRRAERPGETIAGGVLDGRPRQQAAAVGERPFRGVPQQRRAEPVPAPGQVDDERLEDPEVPVVPVRHLQQVPAGHRAVRPVPQPGLPRLAGPARRQPAVEHRAAHPGQAGIVGLRGRHHHVVAGPHPRGVTVRPEPLDAHHLRPPGRPRRAATRWPARRRRCSRAPR